jgi:hypothetical protein
LFSKEFRMSPLDPHHLTPPASLNRVQIIDLPGLEVDDGVKGKTGYTLVSTAALAAIIRARATALALNPAEPDHVLCRALDACLDHPEVSAAADAVARRIGRNLGYLLLTLRRGDAVNRAARPEWDASYWAHWGAIRRVWLSGGIVSGQLGPCLIRYAGGLLVEAGYDDYTLRLSPYGAAAALVGMARRAPADCPLAFIFDFGQTAIKRALAFYDQGVLVALERLSDVATGWGDVLHAPDDPERKAVDLLDQMIDTIGDTCAHARHLYPALPPGPVLASLAAYVRDGQPTSAQGGAYVQIARITDNLQRTLAERLGPWGIAYVVLEHDGTAAAAAHAGEAHAAVIAIGTALGIGFPPDDAAALRPLRDGFVVT